MADVKLKISELSDHDFTQDVIKNALVRFSYLYEDYKIIADNNGYYISGDDKDIQKYIKEFIYLVYREKIFQETLPIRKKIYDTL